MGAGAAEKNSRAMLLPPPADLLVAAPLGTEILRRLTTGVGEGGSVLQKEVPGIPTWQLYGWCRPSEQMGE